MTIPFQWPHIDGSQVVGGTPPSPYPDIGRAFMEAYLGAQRERGLNSRSSAELDLQKQEMAFRIAQEKTKQEQLKHQQEMTRQQGEAGQRFLETLLPHLQMTGGLNQLLSPAAPQSTGWTPQNGAPLPTVQQTQGAPMAQPVAGPGASPAMMQNAPVASTPDEALRRTLTTMSPEALPGIMPAIIELMAQRERLGTEAEKQGRIATALANIADPAKREGARGMIGLAAAGVHPTPEQIGELYPQLRTVDPQMMNAAYDAWKTSLQPWGRIRSQFRLPASAVPDSMIYTGPVGKDKLSTEQSAALQQLPILRSADETMTRLENKGVQLGTLAAMVKRSPTSAIGDILNGIQNPDQREYVSAQLAFGTSATFAFSGKAAPVEQQVRIINDFGMQGSDPAPVRMQKAARRRDLIEATTLILSGHLTPVQGADRLLKSGNLDSRSRQTVMDLRRQAVAFEKEGATGRGPVEVTDAPVTPDSAASIAARWTERIQKAPLGKAPDVKGPAGMLNFSKPMRKP